MRGCAVTITYFAYGANLDTDAMQERCPGAEVLGIATLADHRLVAMREGWLSIAPAPDENVMGLLWALGEDHLLAIDAYEDVADGLYERAHRSVQSKEDGVLEALVYIGSNPGPGVLREEYARRVARAARSALDDASAARILALARP